MDTISRENNSSMLPVGGIIVGVIGLLLGGYAAISLSKVNKTLTEMQPKLETVESSVASAQSAASTAASTAEKASRDIKTLEAGTQDAVTKISNYLGEYSQRLTKLEEAAKKAPAPVANNTKKGGAPVTAGPGEYLVQSGESGAKIARDHGVSLADLQAVNPGVNWNKMSVGQKLKLPSTAKK